MCLGDLIQMQNTLMLFLCSGLTASMLPPPPFQHHRQVSPENQREPGFRKAGSTKLADAGMVPTTHGHAHGPPETPMQEKENSNTAPLKGSTPPGEEVGTPCAEINTVTLRRTNVLQDIAEIIIRSWKLRPKNSTPCTSKNSSSTVTGGTQIPFLHL